MIRSLLVASTAAGVLLSQAAISAAAAEFCFDDPALVFVTPSGVPHTVYLTTFAAGLEHSPQVHAQRYSLHLETDRDDRQTEVAVHVLVPNGTSRPFAVHSVISTGPNGTGKRLANRDGISGRPYTLEFELPD
ncbi:MAG TPA: hypothetical protein VF134_04070 [Candidatus Dormibacteraeota bacterium]